MTSCYNNNTRNVKIQKIIGNILYSVQSTPTPKKNPSYIDIMNNQVPIFTYDVKIGFYFLLTHAHKMKYNIKYIT